MRRGHRVVFLSSGTERSGVGDRLRWRHDRSACRDTSPRRNEEGANPQMLTISGVTFLAIDLGTKRVGVAVSPSGILATPHSVIPHPGDDAALIEIIARLAEEQEAETLVVGIPRTNRVGAAAALDHYRRFAGELRQRTCKEVVLWDETLTSVEAVSKMREAGLSRRAARGKPIDHEAATVILQSYLDEQARRRS